MRVANNLTMFEKNVVEILTMLCTQASDSGLIKTSSDWALELMKPEYKDKIKDVYTTLII